MLQTEPPGRVVGGGVRGALAGRIVVFIQCLLATATAQDIYPTALSAVTGSSTNTLWAPSGSGSGGSAAYRVTNSLEMQNATDRATVASLTGNFLR